MTRPPASIKVMHPAGIALLGFVASIKATGLSLATISPTGTVFLMGLIVAGVGLGAMFCGAVMLIQVVLLLATGVIGARLLARHKASRPGA